MLQIGKWSFTRFVLSVENPVAKFCHCSKKVLQYWSQIADHEATFDESSFRDFLDCFIDKKILKSDSSEDRKLAKQNLRNIILDLFLAGSETTSSTLKWAVLHLALNPDVQAKVQVNKLI